MPPMIEIPVEIGTAVYRVVPSCHENYHYCAFSGGYGTPRCMKGPCSAYIEEIQFNIEMLNQWNKTVFATKDEAAKFLKKHPKY